MIDTREIKVARLCTLNSSRQLFRIIPSHEKIALVRYDVLGTVIY